MFSTNRAYGSSYPGLISFKVKTPLGRGRKFMEESNTPNIFIVVANVYGPSSIELPLRLVVTQETLSFYLDLFWFYFKIDAASIIEILRIL